MPTRPYQDETVQPVQQKRPPRTALTPSKQKRSGHGRISLQNGRFVAGEQFFARVARLVVAVTTTYIKDIKRTVIPCGILMNHVQRVGNIRGKQKIKENKQTFSCKIRSFSVPSHEKTKETKENPPVTATTHAPFPRHSSEATFARNCISSWCRARGCALLSSIDRSSFVPPMGTTRSLPVAPLVGRGDGDGDTGGE